MLMCVQVSNSVEKRLRYREHLYVCKRFIICSSGKNSIWNKSAQIVSRNLLFALFCMIVHLESTFFDSRLFLL